MKAKAAADYNSYASRDRDRDRDRDYDRERQNGGGMMVSNVDNSRANRNTNQYESIVTR